MRCPHCNGECPDGSVICPNCDAILDTSFLEADPAPQPPPLRDGGGHHEPDPPPPLSPDPPGPTQGDDPRPTGGGADAPDLSGHTEGTSILRMDPERDKETRIVKMSDVSSRRASARAQRDGVTGGASASEREGAIDDIWGQVGLALRRLRPAERLTFIFLAAFFVGPFLPWYHVPGTGFISGIESSGGLVAALAFLAMVTFWVRASLRMVLLVLLQVGFIVAAGFFAGYALRNPGGNEPAFGIYVTLLTGLAGAVMSLFAAVKS